MKRKTSSLLVVFSVLLLVATSTLCVVVETNLKAAGSLFLSGFSSDPFTEETMLRNSILAGDYETMGEIKLSGHEVLELKDRTFVIEGNIILEDQAKLIIENSAVVWNNKYFSQYTGRVDNNAILEIRDSTLVRGEPYNMHIYVVEDGILIISNVTSYYDVWATNGHTTIDSSQIMGAVGIGWEADQAKVTITNSRIRSVVMQFHRGEAEDVKLSGLKYGWQEKVAINTLEGGLLEVENSWLQADRDDGWVLDLSDESYREGWEAGSIAPEDSEIKVTLNEKHIIIENSELNSIWLTFNHKSNVKFSNWKPGDFSYWNLHENAEVEGVGFDLTLINSTIRGYAKLISVGKAEFKNVEDVQISSWGNALITVDNAVITHCINARGDESLKITNSVLTGSTLLLRDGRTFSPVGGHIHRLEFNNMTLDPYSSIEIASTYTYITGGITIQISEGSVDYDYGTVERGYPVIIQDVNNMFIANAELELFDQDNKLVWSGTTDQDGKGLFNMTFSNENYTKMWKLEVSSEGLNISKEVGFLTSTPILLTLPKPAEEEPATAGFPIEVLVIGVLLATGVLIIIIKRKKSLNAG